MVKIEDVKSELENAEISATTKKVYLSRLNVLFKMEEFHSLGDEYNRDIISCCEKMNPNNNLNTEITIVRQMLALSKHCPSFQEVIGEEEMGRLRFLHDELSDKCGKKTAEDTLAYRENDVTWEELLKMEENLDGKDIKGEDKMIYKLYIKPGIGFVPRNDFANMKIVESEPKDGFEPNHNYYVKGEKFVFNEYKTSKKYGKITAPTPPSTQKSIEDTCKGNKWLFQNKGGTELNGNTVQKKVSRSFARISGGKHITLVTIRRAFATYIQNLPESERRQIAMKMGHTTSTQKNYTHTLESAGNIPTVEECQIREE